MTPADDGRNSAATAQLRAFVGGLSPADADRPVGGGWTIKAALGHLTFWDRFAALLLEEWRQTGVQPNLDHGEDAYLNRICLPDWLALPYAHTALSVIDAATVVDSRAAKVTPTLREAIIAAGETWALQRFRHRLEHLAQMTQALPPAL